MRKPHEFRPTALDGTHQLEERVVLSRFGAAQIGEFQQSFTVTQRTISRVNRDIDRAFTQLANAYSRSFKTALRTFDGTSRLSNGYNDSQINLLNQRLVTAVSRLPFGVRNLGPDVVGLGDSLRDGLNSLDSVDRTSDRGSVLFASSSARNAIFGTRAEVQSTIRDYIVGGVQDGSFAVR